jgi:uncharacterized membrane protein YraQ (UPF0718 family)
MLPILISVILLLSLIITFVPFSYYVKIFTGNFLIDPLIGAILGSISIGNPITSYLIGGELLKNGVSLIAVIAFILSWVTVGLIQLPAEGLMLGKRFAIIRNLTSFISAIIIAILVSLTLKLF